jgi:hypothetical protein
VPKVAYWAPEEEMTSLDRVDGHECGRYDGKTVKLPWDWKDWVLGERRSPAPLPKVEG